MARDEQSPGGRSQPVDLKTRFERFPASIKGAFVVRGADGNPHAIKLVLARIARVPTGPAKPFPVEDTLLDVAPARDMFVPFEVAVSDLDPAWYAIRSSVQVDGGSTWDFTSRLFTVPWPRSDVRRGTIRLDVTVLAGGERFALDRVEMGNDTAAVVWRPTPTGKGPDGHGPDEGDPGVEAWLLADGEPLDVLPVGTGARTYDRPAPGERRTVSYPVPRSARSLTALIRLSTGEESRPSKVPLA